MGVCFGGALTIVIFAGSDLFTGFNLILTLGVLHRKANLLDLLANWAWTWVGNLAGSVLLAFMVICSGVMDTDPVKSFVLTIVNTKMNIPEGATLSREPSWPTGWFAWVCGWRCASRMKLPRSS